MEHNCNYEERWGKVLRDRKYKNEIGNKYHLLTVISVAPNKNNRAMFSCRCDCGKIIVTSGHDLRCGDKKSCGCKRFNTKQLYKNEINHKYGRLLVVGKSNKRIDNKIVWICKCDCGKLVEVCGRELRNGDTKSCGCYRSELLHQKLLGEGNHMFGRISDKNPNWKGGISSISNLIRSTIEYHRWREEINKKYIACVYCGSIIGLEAHHIEPFNNILIKFLEEYSQFSPLEDKETLVKLALNYKPFWDLDNGITLCKKCHMEETKCNNAKNTVS
jgi:hypothetical protein